MKLIIELSENDYKALKEDGVQNHLALADTIIAHSIPYEEKIKYFPPCEDCNKKMEEIRQAYDKMKATERPQGEWIDHSEDYGYAECPFCEHLTNCEGNIDELHFCWNCGAKLEKAVRNEADS